MNNIQKRNFLISLNKLRNYNNRINEKIIYEQDKKRINLYNEEVKKILKRNEKMYKKIIEKKNTEINILRKQLKGE